MAEYIKSLRPFEGQWEPEREIGAGSFGRVWKAARKKEGKKEYTAIKEILIPGSEEVLREARFEGLDEEGAKLYFRGILDRAEKEAAFMGKLSDCPNIVRFYEYEVRERKELREFGWALYIRMELLVPVREIFLERKFSVRDAARLAVHICNALEYCGKKGIIHRDIKPDNLFYDPKTDTYKLGDFGYAQDLSRATASKKGRPGTLSYMPPEVYQGGMASGQSDLYGLGMILYRMMNHFRIPFLPEYPAPFSPGERDAALMKRLNGEEPGEPQILREQEDEEKAVFLGRIARKSIAACPKDRFQSAKELRESIQKLDLL